MYRHILFDLDGTLTDSQEGIIKSVAYAWKSKGKQRREDWNSRLSSDRR